MKLPDGGDFEGMDPVSAKAALLLKDREVQMVWCSSSVALQAAHD